MPNLCSAIRATLGQRQIRQSPGLALNAHSGNDWGPIPVLTGQLLIPRSNDCEQPKHWLESDRRHFLSPTVSILNELLMLMANNIIRKLCDGIQGLRPNLLSLLMAQPIIRVKNRTPFQSDLLMRTLNRTRFSWVSFIMASTDWRALASMILDVLLRSNLSVANLRGQTYDGAVIWRAVFMVHKPLLQQNSGL